MSTAEAVACPFCGANQAQLVALFGSQLLLSQYRCAVCRTYFEGVRPDLWARGAESDTMDSRRGGPDPDGRPTQQ